MINRFTVKKITYGLALCFLIIHVMLLLLFYLCGVIPMVIVNCFSIIFYVSTFFMIRRDSFQLYMVTVYLEVLAHMAFAVYFTGWSSGFQITLLGMQILGFYGEYLAYSMKWRSPHAIVLSVIAMTEYISLFIITSRQTAGYPLPDFVSFFLNILWAVIVFGIGTACLLYFVHIAVRSERYLENEAQTDHLTGLYNRAAYEKILADLDLMTMVLLLIDGDRFKDINDHYGHETGDRVLQEIARTLKHNFRSDDYICRVGGDEFAVLMRADAGNTKETLKAKITKINQELLQTEEPLPPVSISVGIAFGQNCKDRRELFGGADEALYTVKAAGGGGCAFARRKESGDYT